MEIAMQISDINCFPCWGGHRNYMFVVIDTDAGIEGIGEAGLTGMELAVQGAIAHWRELLIGQDPMRTEHIWQTLSRGAFFPHGRVLGSALAAIDMALWDIKAKALGVPLYQLFGGRSRDAVACYCHLAAGHEPGTELLLRSAEEHIDAGWRYLRWGLPSEGALLEPTRAVQQAVEQFAALRRNFGDEIELCFDVHTRLSPTDAATLCNAVEAYRPYFIEDPLRSESPQAYHALRQRTRVPLAAGEQFASKWEFRELIDHDLIDYARIDLCIAGGFTEGLKIAGWAEAHYIDVVVHNPLGPVAATACLHFNMAIPNFGVQEQPQPTATMLTDVVQNQPVWVDGAMVPNDLPGLGLVFDREAALQHPFSMTALPRLHRADGTFTNW